MRKQMFIERRWIGKLVGLILLAAVLLVPAAATDDTVSVDNAIANPGFEEPATGKSAAITEQGSVPGWQTTATDGKIELGGNWTGNAPHYTSSNKKNAEGHQFAELNANEESTLYQDVTTLGGNVYEWGLQHRGRMGTDKMALIIGPTQDNAPTKPSKNGRDQYMQLTDWVQENQAALHFAIPDNGCSQRLTVYSKKFGPNGTFLGGSGAESPFSMSASNIYTERWDLWIIATGNGSWKGYGIKDAAYQADQGIGGGLGYECSYQVPDGQTKTTFAFCSYSASGGNKTLGNLIDDLQFSLFHTVTISATAGSSKITASSVINRQEQNKEIPASGGSIMVGNNQELTVKAWEKSDVMGNGLTTSFAGALVIGQDGSKFYSVDDDPSLWEKVAEPDEYGEVQYVLKLKITEPVAIRLIYVQSPAVTYYANGGTYDGESSQVVSFQQTEGQGEVTYTSHAATGKTGWRFDGWLTVRDNYLLPAEHKATYNYNPADPAFTFTYGAKSDEVHYGGVTLVAQWSYLQRAVVQLRGDDGTFTDNAEAGTVTMEKSTGSSTQCYAKTGASVTATAAAKTGYYFLGWVEEGSDEYVSTNETYTYRVSGQETRTVYARFAPKCSVTYEWSSEFAPTTANLPALPVGGFVLQGDSYAISTMYSTGQQPATVKDTVAGVPGHWAFNGWKDKDNPDGGFLTGSILKVERDYTLVGYWTWVPNSQYVLTYSIGDNTISWIPADENIVAPAGGNYYEDSSVAVAAKLDTSRKKVMLNHGLELEGTWRFTGWKRSDNGEVVAADSSITMPGHNLVLTAQWEFTPYTYTVKYDLAGGNGQAPEPHTTFDYSAYVGNKTGVVQKDGIPFYAPITLRDFTGTAPEDTYFAGWSLENTQNMTDAQKDSVPTQGAGAVVDSTMMNVTTDGAEVTLYAVYRNTSKITVEFDVNDPEMGEVDVKSGVFTVAGENILGTDVISTATPKAGYHFTGWTVTVQDESNAPSPDLSQAKLTVQTQHFTKDDAGKRFVYTANFEPNRFTVHFDKDADEATGTMDDQQFTFSTKDDSSPYLNPNAFQRPGYVFLGWSEYSNAEGQDNHQVYPDRHKFAAVTTYRDQPIANGDTVTLYAIWERLPDVTIRYEVYGSGTVQLNQQGTSGEFVTETGNPEIGPFYGATAAAAEGWEFAGWYHDGSEISEELSFVPEKDQTAGVYLGTTYVARFRQKVYQLTYNANAADATGAMDAQSFIHGEGKSLTENAFVRPGYSFMGWATTPDGKVTYTNQQIVSIEQDTALYAVWQEDTVTLFYDTEDASKGTVTPESETVNAVTTPTAAGSTAKAKTGFRFAGWYSETGEKLSDSASFAPAKPEDGIWKTAHYIARFEPVSDPTPADPEPGYFAIRKVDAQDSYALNGAVFELYQYNGAGEKINRITAETAQSGSENGIALFQVNGLSGKDGDWYYAEVTAPEGYTLDATEHKLTKKAFAASQSAAIQNAVTVQNQRSATPGQLDETDHFAYIIGYEDGLVKPNGLLSRAETTTIFFRLLKDSVRDGNLSTSNSYTDVPEGFWANTAISTMTGLGIVQGRGNGTFDPNAPITRGEFAAICARLDAGTAAGTEAFSDIGGHWAGAYIQRAAELGWVKGFEDGTYRPDAYITRAEAMTLINRVLNRLPEDTGDLLPDMTTWPDCTTNDWFYLAVQEATNSHDFQHKAGIYETWTGMKKNPNWTRYEK